MRKPLAVVGLCCAVLSSVGLGAAPTAAAGDEVTEQIDEARRAYEKKDLAAAAAALDAAANLIRQMKAAAWKELLPGPLPGWTAEDAESVAFGTALLGGGTAVSRKYRRGNDTVEISLVTDSPVLQGLGAFLAGGLVTSSDTKLSIVEGRRLTYSKSDNSYQTMVANKALIQVKASPKVDDQTLRAYVGAVKFREIEKALP